MELAITVIPWVSFRLIQGFTLHNNNSAVTAMRESAEANRKYVNRNHAFYNYYQYYKRRQKRSNKNLSM